MTGTPGIGARLRCANCGSEAVVTKASADCTPACCEAPLEPAAAGGA